MKTPERKQSKPKSKQGDTTSREEFFAEFGTILEDIRNTVLMTAEGVASVRSELGGKIDDVRSELHEFRAELKSDITIVHDKLNGKIEELRGEFTGLRDEFGVLRNEFSEFRDETKNSFKTLNKKFDTLNEEILDIKNGLANVKKRLTKKADLEYVSSLELRVKNIEKYIQKQEKISA
jgi:uncharacterized coiled-coil DUF342 family protein